MKEAEEDEEVEEEKGRRFTEKKMVKFGIRIMRLLCFIFCTRDCCGLINWKRKKG